MAPKVVKSSSGATSELDLDSELRSFCQRELFKQYVRSAINDEMFWRDLFDHYRIENKVDNHLNTKVPTMVRNGVREKVQDMVPGLVTQKLAEQLPNFLRDSHEMKEILARHSVHLNEQLENAARVHLKKIVEEEHYHEVNKAFFDAVDARANAAISAFTQKGNGEIDSLKAKCATELAQYTEQMGRVTQFETDLAACQKRIGDLETSNWRLTLGLMSTSVVFTGFITFLWQRR